MFLVWLLLCFSNGSLASLKLDGDSFADTDQLSLSFQPQENLTLTFSGKLHPFVDEHGGYGSDLYAELEFFAFPVDGETVAGTDIWVGFQNRYDIEAIRISSEVWQVSVEDDPVDTASVKLVLETAEPRGGEVVVRYYQGPRDRAKLHQLKLDQALLYEQWAPFRQLCLLIWSLLLWFYGVAGSWGIAILLLALIIRVLTIPVTRISLDYQQRAIEQQNRMAAKVAELKQTATGLELSEKMVALYEAEGYDHLAPFKGMLGLFIQIPILIALFSVIGEMSVLREQQFLWIADLSLSDRISQLGFELPFFGGYLNLLPFLMALTTILSTWVAGFVSKVEVSAGGLYGMALVFFVFFYSFPAALVLYWFASNFFQLLQQLVELILKR